MMIILFRGMEGRGVFGKGVVKGWGGFVFIYMG